MEIALENLAAMCAVLQESLETYQHFYKDLQVKVKSQIS